MIEKSVGCGQTHLSDHIPTTIRVRVMADLQIHLQANPTAGSNGVHRAVRTVPTIMRQEKSQLESERFWGDFLLSTAASACPAGGV
jgi:hypothetical protein